MSAVHFQLYCKAIIIIIIIMSLVIVMYIIFGTLYSQEYNYCAVVEKFYSHDSISPTIILAM